MFGDLEYDPACAYTASPIEEQLEALAAAVRAGKVRAVRGAAARSAVQQLSALGSSQAAVGGSQVPPSVASLP